MKIQILKKIILENLPSASGVDVFQDKIYIIGDDSPLLYILDKNYNLLEKIEIFKTEHFSSGRIPKKLKEDLECSTIINYENQDYLLLAGSGSNENRNNAYLINLATNYIEKFSLKLIYSLFLDIYEDISLINVEGVCNDDTFVYFFNRGGKNSPNLVLRMRVSHLFEYFKTKNIENFSYMLYNFELPSINNINSGFSGATFFDNKIFFTSSVENTDNAIDDGEVLGSLIGVANYEFENNLEIVEYSKLTENNIISKLKIESITILSKENNKYKALLVEDDDLGGSQILEALIELEKL
ncbi:MAG: hypothetical protein U0354_07320 [Candidatus Sericytochromatia bacterium]